MRYLLQFFLTSGIIFFAVRYQYITGITLENGYTSLLIFSVILGIINIFLGTALRFITAPINFFTLGLVSWIISLIMVVLTDALVPGISISGFLPILMIALINGISTMIIKLFF